MPSPLRKFLRRFSPSKAARKKGQTLVEYALILALISVAMIGAMRLLGGKVTQIFSSISTLLDTAQGSH